MVGLGIWALGCSAGQSIPSTGRTGPWKSRLEHRAGVSGLETQSLGEGLGSFEV